MRKRVFIIIASFFGFIQGFSQSSTFSFEDRMEKLERESEPLRRLVEDIRRAVYASEQDLKDCLPDFTSATITLEGSTEGNAGIELNLVVFKITSKRKRGRTNKSVITFVRDTLFRPLMHVSHQETNENFNTIRNLIVSQGYINCISSRAVTNLTNEIKNKTVPYSIYGHEDVVSIPMDAAEDILTEAFKTKKLEVEVSFIVENESSLGGEFKITPLTGSLTGNLKRKNIQTVKVTFGEDPK